MANQEQKSICREIGARTGGDIYIGVVGPVRSGKSTFIKRFMEQLVLPEIGAAAARERARDELPQSAAGRTIMTTEPKFIPETAVPLQLEGGGVFFDRCLAQLPGVRPEQCLMIGDSLTADIAGGRAAGMQTCWFDPTDRGAAMPPQADWRITRLEELFDIL